MLPDRRTALEQLTDFGFSVRELRTDTSGVVRVKIRGRRQLDGYYQAWTVAGSDLISGFFGTWYPEKEQKNFFVQGSGDYKISDADKFRLEDHIKKSKAIVESKEPDLKSWHQADLCETHPYLTKKNVKSNNLRKAGDELLIPFFKNRELVGVQRVFKDGKKMMITGSQMKGASHTIIGNHIIAICEGYATGATINEKTGWTAVCCYSASNLWNVARHYKSRAVIVCADNDKNTFEKMGVNTGIKYGREVADKLFCKMISPVEDGDFNDHPEYDYPEVLTLIEQVKRIDTSEEAEIYLMERADLLASFDKPDFSFFQNRIKEDVGISKKFLENLIAGKKSEEQLQQMEEAKEKLEEVYYFGSTYHRLTSKNFYNTTAQAVTLMLNVAAGDDGVQKSNLLNELLDNRQIEEVVAESKPTGKSSIVKFLGTEGKIIIKKQISVQEQIESLLSELNEVVINEKFIEHIRNEFSEVVEIMFASLARKFCEHKKAFVYLKCNSGYGKTFFFNIEGLARSFSKKYEKEEFKGNNPEDFVKSLYMFVDEANCFPSEYKINRPEYRKHYGGLTKTNLAMRVLACANPIEDIERGVDEQLQERIIKIEPKYKKLSHCGIERNLSHKIWKKWILQQFLIKIDLWKDDFAGESEKWFEKFIDKYKTEKFIEIEDVLKDNLDQLMQIVTLNDGSFERSKKFCSFDFVSHLHELENGKTLITSPIKFFKELFMYFDESRFKAFKSKYRSINDLETISFLSKKLKKIRGRTYNGMIF